MYEIIKRVIASGKYDLTAMLTKIDTIWIQGDLTDEQRGELIESARTGAQPQQSVDVIQKLTDLEKRVRVLEEKDTIVVDPDQPDDPSVDINAIPEYEAGKWYYAGDTVKHKGKVYTCTAPEGQVCVWSPEDYPAYWEVVEAAAEEEQ
ncbi:carbohydrate-binding protein [uncultured Dubosiella sp.]|uniref:carbohydrate-binding protein n=1 Tax=uncultured Dubosiella sp. TaxID=1937011 RepID=UPI0025B5A798|nr:carbohydrate-binding protein [uncultured Dubosiella sp.]